MEIHVPHKPVLTVKEFFVHLAMITLGVFIALSFEGIASWFDHRALARDATANLTNEIRDNKKELDRVLSQLGQTHKDLEEIAKTVSTLADAKTPKPKSLSVGVHFQIASLQSASRTSAEVTGAFSFMEYEKVKKYAGVYDIQQEFEKVQESALQTVLSTIADVQVLKNPDTIKERDFDELRQSLRRTEAVLIGLEQLGKQLSSSFDSVLSGKTSSF